MNNETIYKDAPNYLHPYFNLVETDNLLEVLEKSKQFTKETIHLIPAERENYRYEAGKWSTKETIRHIIDAERIFAHRAFRFSRGDRTALSGFDQDKYILSTKDIHQNLSELLQEYLIVRQATTALFQNMTEEMLDFKGKIGDAETTARVFGFMTVGHNLHHCKIIRERYL